MRSTPHLQAVPAMSPPGVRRSTMVLLVGIAVLVVASFATLPLEWNALFSLSAATNLLEFIRGFAPPEASPAFLQKLASATAETAAMSALGTLIAVVAGMAIALPASGRLGRSMRLVTRLALNVLRSIPELVWASILLIAAGLGPFAGTLALAAHTAGVLGRLFADALENASPLPESALRINGASPMAAFLYATLPQTIPQMLSYTLYRWENNIRAAAVLGVVGAGGLGQMLKYHLSLFHMQQAASVILAMLALVAAVDAVSFWLRRQMTR